MRRANTTFVNLRAALDDVDPLVDAAKPVARRLGPVPGRRRGCSPATASRPSATCRGRSAPRPEQRPDRADQQLPAARARGAGHAARERRRPPRRLPRDDRRAQGRRRPRSRSAARTRPTSSAGWTTSRRRAATTRSAASRARGSTSRRSSTAPGPKTEAVQAAARAPTSMPAADGSNVFSRRRGRGAQLRPEPEVGGPVMRRRGRRAGARARRVRGRAGARAPSDDDARGQDLQDRLRQRLRPHRGRRLQGRAASGPARPPASRSEGGRRPRSGRDGRGHRARLRGPAQGRALRDPPAVADRRVLRGLPARRPRTSASPTAGACRSSRPARRSRPTWSTTSCAAPTASACG